MSFGHDVVPGAGRARLQAGRAILEVVSGEAAHFPLTAMRLVVGRSEPPHHRVDVDLGQWDTGAVRTVSRRHAELQWVDGRLLLSDLGSRNGTRVNGVVLTPVGASAEPRPLEAGDLIAFGGVELRLLAAVPS